MKKHNDIMFKLFGFALMALILGAILTIMADGFSQNAQGVTK